MFQPKAKEESDDENEEAENAEVNSENKTGSNGGSSTLQTSVSANFNQLNPDIVHALFRNSKATI